MKTLILLMVAALGVLLPASRMSHSSATPVLAVLRVDHVGSWGEMSERVILADGRVVTRSVKRVNPALPDAFTLTEVQLEKVRNLLGRLKLKTTPRVIDSQPNVDHCL